MEVSINRVFTSNQTGFRKFSSDPKFNARHTRYAVSEMKPWGARKCVQPGIFILVVISSSEVKTRVNDSNYVRLESQI